MNKSEQTVDSDRKELTDAITARRAYEISELHDSGSAEENWFRAEAELGLTSDEGPGAE